MADSPLITRIRKILERARHHSTPEDEALELQAKARDLMLEYEVDPSVVEERDASGDYILRAVRMAKVEHWVAHLYQRACAMFFCEMVVNDWPLETARAVYIFGAKRHADIAVSFADYLVKAVERKLTQALGGRGLEADPSFIASFNDAASLMLGRRIEQRAKQKAQPSTPGTNLPVPADLLIKTQEALKKLVGDESVMQVSEQVRTDNALGTVLGSVAGNDISLDAQIGAGGAHTSGLLGQG